MRLLTYLGYVVCGAVIIAGIGLLLWGGYLAALEDGESHDLQGWLLCLGGLGTMGAGMTAGKYLSER
jgi:hypothetical protein